MSPIKNPKKAPYMLSKTSLVAMLGHFLLVCRSRYKCIGRVIDYFLECIIDKE